MSSTDFSITPLDFEQWPRKQHFELFQQFTQPYFNVCVQLNAKKLYTACKQANISRQTYYRWIEDESFSELCDNVKEGLIDLAENQLLNKIKKGDITAIIFFLKCRGKKRGYTEKQEVEISKPITDINFDEL